MPPKELNKAWCIDIMNGVKTRKPSDARLALG